jgi:hypothetical protein
MRTSSLGQEGIVSNRVESGGGEWRVDAVEELEEQDAHAEALRRQAVRLGLRYFEDQALGAQFGQVVPQLAQPVRGGGRAKRFGGSLMEILGPKTAAP